MGLKSLIKKYTFLYKSYYYLVKLVVAIIKCFVKRDDKLILFVSYGGRYYNDSPKCIYEAMLKDKRFSGYSFIWAFIKPDEYDIPTRKVNINSISYFLTALKARCWVTNVSIERGLNFKGKHTFYFHTTHTTLPKLSGYDGEDFKTGVYSLYKIKYDCSCAQSLKEKELQKSMYDLRDDQILVSGYPKNDILCRYTEEQRNRIRTKLGIPDGKIVILYAPTYRDVYYGAMKCPVDFKKWESFLGENYVVLFRAHPVVANNTIIDSSTGFIYDESNYPDNSELMIAADILISDYSGIFFEYAVQKKPMFCYAYDYEDYIKHRQLYFDIRKMIPGGLMKEEDLLNTIKSGSYEIFESQWNQFRKDYVSEYGNATEKCLDTIFNNIKY